MQRLRGAKGERAQLVLGVLAHEDRARHELFQIRADHGRAVPVHQHRGMLTKCAGERASLLGLDDQKIGGAEFVILIPERRLLSHRRAEMENRNDRLADDTERHHRRCMMMTHREHVATRLVDAAVNDALRVEQRFRWPHRLGIEREFQNVVGFDQYRRARARQQIAIRIIWMPYANMAESIKHAFMREDAIGERQFLDRICYSIEHSFPQLSPRMAVILRGQFDQAVNPRTLKARIGRCRPFMSSSPSASISATFSTATWTRPSIKICPSLACPHKREPRLTTVPFAE